VRRGEALPTREEAFLAVGGARQGRLVMTVYLVLFVGNGLGSIFTAIVVPTLWWLPLISFLGALFPAYLIRKFREGERANLAVLPDDL
jgi:hypothetical protein